MSLFTNCRLYAYFMEAGHVLDTWESGEFVPNLLLLFYKEDSREIRFIVKLPRIVSCHICVRELSVFICVFELTEAVYLSNIASLILNKMPNILFMRGLTAYDSSKIVETFLQKFSKFKFSLPYLDSA